MTRKIKVNLYTQEGKKLGEETLDPAIFGIEVKEGLIKQAVVAQMANARKVLAHTKNRGEVRGGGRKPWKQKGTGRARHGSIRSPIWVGGGITFGPRKDRNFSLKINKKMKRKALLMALSDKVASEHLIVLEKFELATPKTKEMAKIINNIKLNIYNFKKEELGAKKGSTLMILPGASADKQIRTAGENLSNLAITRADSLNVVDILKYQYLLMPKEAVSKIVAVYGQKTALKNKKASSASSSASAVTEVMADRKASEDRSEDKKEIKK
jgi:large subunit ribosomal protein L4